jgi:hypothetical protein
MKRINQALKKNLQDFKASVKASEPPKISYLRSVLTQSCGSFESVSSTLGMITALQLPITLRKGYIRDFCGTDKEASRAEVLKNLEKIELQCEAGSNDDCDLKDVYDSIDCSRVDDFLNEDFDGLISRFKSLDTKIIETRKICGDNITALIRSCLDLDLGKENCLIPHSEGGACERLQIGPEFCAQ